MPNPLINKLIAILPPEREIKWDCNECLSCESGMTNCEVRDQDKQYNLARQDCINALPEMLEVIAKEIPLYRAGVLEDGETAEFRKGRNAGLKEVRDLLTTNKDE